MGIKNIHILKPDDFPVAPARELTVDELRAVQEEPDDGLDEGEIYFPPPKLEK